MSAINSKYIFNVKESLDPGCSKENETPHVYITSGKAYEELKRTGRNQSILVSGESGAGKVIK